ncbi:MAG: hypothetical protein LBL90_00545 [Prevotellaceae bacterium]|jgi:tricorn protease|nr:hypothetical protein [Prevotellaceae bacterium]
MKKLLLNLFFLVPFVVQGQDSLFFATQPAISPDGKEIYFCYDGDIWHVAADGGTALRVTGMTGYQTSPHVSPDGKWLAFTSDEQGNNNVYITPIAGGSIKQLTFHESQDNVASWSVDSKWVYFESNRYNGRSTYKVSIDGGTPQRLFAGYFNTIVNLVEDPVSGKLYFNEASESFNQPTRKGYKGDNNPDIKSWDPAKKEYKQLTTYRGKDIWPSVDSKGNLYWATDERNGEYNIARWENGKPNILTDFTTAIHYPQVSFNGEKVVFTKDYVIHVYDVASEKTTIPAIKAFEPDSPDIMQSYSSDAKISVSEISPDGKKLAFVSRGRLFISDTKGLFIQSVDTDIKERIVEVKWAKDNKTLYYTRTRAGWYNLYKISAETCKGEKAVYTPDNMVKSLTMSNDRSMIAFITGSDRIEALYCGTDKIEKLADNEFWSFNGYSIEFSPDDKYLAYVAMNLFERDIFIYDFTNKKSFNLTNSASVDDSPAWSVDGKYLYLTANRYDASFPGGARTNLYRIRLNYTDKPYVTDKFNELFSSDTTKKTDAKKTPVNISINMDDIQRRWETVQGLGSQSWVSVLKSGAKNYLLYSSNHEGAFALYIQELLDFDQKPAKKISDVTSVSSMSYNGKDLYVVQRGNVYSIDLSNASAKKVDLKQNFSQNNRNEFNQMFYEVWALLTENFYDPGLHGVDWKKKCNYYAQFLPHVKSRRDFRTMVNDMLGELNSSHLGFSSSGSEERRATTMKSLETGITFDNNSPYLVAAVLKGSPAYVVDQKVKPGDELVAVNGVTVDKNKNRENYFISAINNNEIKLTFRRTGANYDVTLHTMPSYNLNNIYYTMWEDDCRQRVTEKTKGRVAYHHMRDMGSGSLNNFFIDMATDAVHKDALILDLRYNNGGNVHNEVIEYLRRVPYFTWKYRNHQSNTHPNVTPGNKPIVVLINERSLSDAEVTSNGIQTLGIGKLIGTETYRWIIFTSGSMLVDGSFCRIPGWGCYNMKGEDMEFAGVTPDIYVKNTFEDRLNGNDPQLDRAIDEILKELK